MGDVVIALTDAQGDLQSRLDANGATRGVTAIGLFDDDNVVMSVNSMTVHIIDLP